MSTLSSTFFLKEPKSDRETLILFSCYFKHEEKKFVYSTGEKILSKAWDFKNRQPKLHGSNRSKYAKTIQSQINRYSDKFDEVQDMCKRSGEEDFTSKILRDEFDKEFKKSKTGKNLFFSHMMNLWIIKPSLATGPRTP